jgi:hypothetical protein
MYANYIFANGTVIKTAVANFTTIPSGPTVVNASFGPPDLTVPSILGSFYLNRSNPFYLDHLILNASQSIVFMAPSDYILQHVKPYSSILRRVDFVVDGSVAFSDHQQPYDIAGLSGNSYITVPQLGSNALGFVADFADLQLEDQGTTVRNP